MPKTQSENQLTLPLYPKDPVAYKKLVKQNWQMTFSSQYMTSVYTKRATGLVLAQMKDESEMRDVYHIPAADIIRETGLQRAEVYKQMKTVIYELAHVCYIFESEENGTILPRHLIDTTRYEDPIIYKNGVLTLAFNPALKQIALDLAHSSSYELEAYLRFSSWYSMRLWEILSAWRDTGWWQASIEEYRRLMGCGVEIRKGKPVKDANGNLKYVKYPKTADLIKKTTAEPIKELKGTELEFHMKIIYSQRPGRGRKPIEGIRFDLLWPQRSDAEKIDIWSRDSEKFRRAVERLRAWKVNDRNIVKYSKYIGPERINQLLFSWQNKNIKGSRDPISNPESYCNIAFEAEGKKALEKIKAEKEAQNQATTDIKIDKD